ncbi:MAG: lipopolysaccharide biosynthesis protein RfbH [Anaerolineales bacterium]
MQDSKWIEGAQQVRAEILRLVGEYYRLAHGQEPFVPGETFVNYGGRVYDERELQAATEAVLDFWLTDGPRVAAFSTALARYQGLEQVLPVNSGSSANLIALAALRSEQLERPLLPGDEVITPAATFATTVAPIVQQALVPVFVDCRLGTYNIDVALLDAALSERTRALFVPHILGNPVEMDRVLDFAQAHDLYVIEDTCDALGSRYGGRPCGSFGHLSTYSFYPAHHITTGEGGALGTDDERLYCIARTLRDWGRAYPCGDEPGGRVGGVEGAYDPRYTFTEIGYNLKFTEVAAAIGLPQLEKLSDFVAARKRNFEVLYRGLQPYEEHLVLPVWAPKADPAWFAFTLAVREGAPFTREELDAHLNAHLIETRYLFAGNILEQPAYRHIPHRVATPLTETDRVLRSAFFIGCYPGMDAPRLAYVLEVFEAFFAKL